MLQMIRTYVADRFNREEGASMVEYGLLVALIAVVVALAAGFLGTAISDMFGSVTDTVGSTTAVAPAPPPAETTP